jgi:hypothetical protein
MGVEWHRKLLAGLGEGLVQLMDVDEDSRYCPNQFRTGQDEVRDDRLMEDSSLEVFPEQSDETWEQCHFNPDFPQLDRLRDMVRNHDQVLFQVGLRVDPLELHVQPNAKFRMCNHVATSSNLS